MGKNYIFLNVDSRNQQAYGIAFKSNGLLVWVYDQGPGKFYTYTERCAKYEALQSNNQKEDGPFIAVPIPDDYAKFDLEEDEVEYVLDKRIKCTGQSSILQTHSIGCDISLTMCSMLP